MSDPASHPPERFERTYPEKTAATLSWSLQFNPSRALGSKLQLPDFFLRPGEAVLLFLGNDGRVTVKAFGEKECLK